MVLRLTARMSVTFRQDCDVREKLWQTLKVPSILNRHDHVSDMRHLRSDNPERRTRLRTAVSRHASHACRCGYKMTPGGLHESSSWSSELSARQASRTRTRSWAIRIQYSISARARQAFPSPQAKNRLLTAPRRPRVPSCRAHAPTRSGGTSVVGDRQTCVRAAEEVTQVYLLSDSQSEHHAPSRSGEAKVECLGAGRDETA